MTGLQTVQFSQEQLSKLGIGSYVGAIEVLLQILRDKLSPEELKESLARRFYERGKMLGGAGSLSKLKITGNDALAIGTLVDLGDEAMLIKGRVIEASPDRVVKEITKCPMQHMPVDLCYAWEAQCQGMVEAINPQYKGSTVKTIAGGDPVCQVVIEKKQALPQKVR